MIPPFAQPEIPLNRRGPRSEPPTETQPVQHGANMPMDAAPGYPLSGGSDARACVDCTNQAPPTGPTRRPRARARLRARARANSTRARRQAPFHPHAGAAIKLEAQHEAPRRREDSRAFHVTDIPFAAEACGWVDDSGVGVAPTQSSPAVPPWAADSKWVQEAAALCHSDRCGPFDTNQSSDLMSQHSTLVPDSFSPDSITPPVRHHDHAYGDFSTSMDAHCGGAKDVVHYSPSYSPSWDTSSHNPSNGDPCSHPYSPSSFEGGSPGAEHGFPMAAAPMDALATEYFSADPLGSYLNTASHSESLGSMPPYEWGDPYM